MAEGPAVSGIARKRRLVSLPRTMIETLPEKSGGRIESYFFRRQRNI